MIVQDKKLTGRQKRMQHFKDMHARSGLNLVSLMDIFTILVFFLLVNTSAQQLPSSKDIKLPTSVSTKTPDENLVIAVTKDSIIVAGHKVANVNAVLASAEPVIPELVSELGFQASQNHLLKDAKGESRDVTIMGDESIPYKLLSKILNTCRQANYTHIAFAAYQKKKE